jgi:hypothetical protein
MKTPNKDSVTSKDIASHIEAMENAAYQRGWDAAIAAITSAANRMQSSAPAKLAKNPLNPKISNGEPAPDRGWLTKLVQEFIKSHQGKTRREVAEGLHAQNPAVNEESVKTAIKRLVRAEKVEDKSGKLY